MSPRPRCQPPPVPLEALRTRPSAVPELPPDAWVFEAQPPPVPPEALRRKAIPVVQRAPSASPPPIPAAARHRRRGEATVSASEASQRAAEATALVEAARAGDPRAFGKLVERYRPRILALALHITGTANDAEDIAQDVFLKAFQHLAEFEGRSAFFTWIYRIAMNRALQVRQQRRIRQGVDLDDPRVALAVAVDAHAAPHRALELRETYAQLVFAFDRLSPTLKTTVVLTTLQGLSYPEAAVVLGTTEGTIAWRMHEAREQLRRSLEVAATSSEVVREGIRQSGAYRVPERASAASLSGGRRRKATEEDTATSYSLAFALASVMA